MGKHSRLFVRSSSDKEKNYGIGTRKFKVGANSGETVTLGSDVFIGFSTSGTNLLNHFGGNYKTEYIAAILVICGRVKPVRPQ
jgi:hypothetical protein